MKFAPLASLKESDLQIDQKRPVTGTSLLAVFKNLFGQLNPYFDSINKLAARGISLTDNIQCEVVNGTFTHGVAQLVSLKALQRAGGAIVVSCDGQLPAAPPTVRMVPGLVAANGTPLYNVTMWFNDVTASKVNCTLVLFTEGQQSTKTPTFIPPGGGGGSSLTPVSKSASYSANANEMVLMSTPAANAVVTLPTPTSGATVGLADVSGFAGGASDGTGKLLSIAAVSGLINGFASWVCFDDYGTATLIADGSNWNFVSGIDHWMPDPRNLSPAAWWDMGRGYTVTGAGGGASITYNKLTALLDQSGNGLTLSQATPGIAPIFDRGGMTGRARALFDGSTFFMTTANMTPGAATYTILIILQSAQIGSSVFASPLAQSANGTAGQGFAVFVTCNAVNTPMKAFVSGDAVAGSTLGVSGSLTGGGFASAADIKLMPHLFSWSVDSGGNAYDHVDGTDATISPTATTTISSPQSAPIYLGQDHFGGANADWFQGTILEVLVFFGSKSAAAIAPYERGLMRKHRLRM